MLVGHPTCKIFNGAGIIICSEMQEGKTRKGKIKPIWIYWSKR